MIQKKHRRFLLFLLPLVCILGLYFSFLIRVPLVIVAPIDAPIYGVSTTELAQQCVVVPHDYVKHVARYIPQKNIYAAADIYQAMLENNTIAVIPWYMLEPRLQIVRLNDVYFWDAPQDYGLDIKRFGFNIPRFKSQRVHMIAIGGTVVLSRGVANVIDRTKDVNYPWQDIAALLKKADLAIVNFKSPLVYSYVKPESKMQLYGKASHGQSLVKVGIDLVSLAGNHVGDAGAQGIADTLDILQKLQITTMGVGKTLDDAYMPVIKKVGKLNVGFVGLNTVGPAQYADQYDHYYVASNDQARLAKVLGQLRLKTDFIVVMTNWGEEYKAVPNEFQRSFGRFLIDNGVDMVVGDQAHWVQELEWYNGKPIFYGLSNLIFDQSWSPETREGLLLRVCIYDHRVTSIDLCPVYLGDDWYTVVTKDPEIIKRVYRSLKGAR